MANKASPGLSYYNMNCGHTLNSKVKMLVHDCKGIGYFIWCCILDHSYSHTGYYFDCSQEDWLELFAVDNCKESLEVVKKVISSSVKRGLFDKNIYEEFSILTSIHMQEFYIEATGQRRRKGTIISFREDLLLIEIPEGAGNILIVPGNNSIVPGHNKNITGQNPQRKKVK